MAIQSFTDLIAWKEAHRLTLNIYTITLCFPTSERYGLTNQVRRASISITSNIAEGFSRRTKRDKNNFYYMALLSLAEANSQLLIARDLKYIKEDRFQKIGTQIKLLRKLINGLLKSSLTK